MPRFNEIVSWRNTIENFRGGALLISFALQNGAPIKIDDVSHILG
jgi:hypothetical protein